MMSCSIGPASCLTRTWKESAVHTHQCGHQIELVGRAESLNREETVLRKVYRHNKIGPDAVRPPVAVPLYGRPWYRPKRQTLRPRFDNPKWIADNAPTFPRLRYDRRATALAPFRDESLGRGNVDRSFR